MGLTSWAKNKIQDMKAERAYNKAESLERREQYNQGRRKAEYEKGLTEGYGRVSEVTEYNARGKPVKTQKYAAPAQPTGRSGGGARWTPDWGTADKIFGSGGGFGGFDMFGDNKPKQPPAMRTTRISPSGKVTISEPYEKKQPMQQRDPVGDLWNVQGVGGVPRKKGERDPYDFIL